MSITINEMRAKVPSGLEIIFLLDDESQFKWEGKTLCFTRYFEEMIALIIEKSSKFRENNEEFRKFIEWVNDFSSKQKGWWAPGSWS